MFQMFHLLQTYVAFKCFMFQRYVHKVMGAWLGLLGIGRRSGRMACLGAVDGGVLVLIPVLGSCPHRERSVVVGKESIRNSIYVIMLLKYFIYGCDMDIY